MELRVTKELVFAYLANNCSALQKRLIEKWLHVDTNQELFYSWLCEWERNNLQYEIDVEKGLERHREWVRTWKNGGVSVSTQRRYDNWTNYGVVAAAILVLLLGTGLSFGDKLLYRNYRTSVGEIRKITLNDDSRVTLHANSILKVPRFFNLRAVRYVSLDGEATFEVSRTRDRKMFIIDTGDQTEIEVLGTVFNVYARKAEKRIALAEGKVQVNYVDQNSGKKSITLKPGELVTLDQSGRVNIRKTGNSEAYFGWEKSRFVFDSFTFEQVGRHLKEIFGTQIVFSDTSLAKQTISGTFTASSPEEFLDILKQGGEFDYQNLGQKIVISPLRVTNGISISE